MSQGSWQRSRCPWAAGKSSRGLLPAPPLPSWSLWAQPRAHSPCHSPAPPQTPRSASGTHLWLRCTLPVCSPPENANWHAAVVLSGTFLIGFGICCCFLAPRLLDFPLPLIFFFSLRLVAAFSAGCSVENRRNQGFIFRSRKRNSTQGKCNYFRLLAGF